MPFSSWVKIADKIFSSKSKLQITGPKTTDEIYAIHNGKLNQILIEFTPSGFYNLFQQSPNTLVNTTAALSRLLPKRELLGLMKNLAKSKDYKIRIKLLEDFLLSYKSLASNPIDFIEKAIIMIDESHGDISVKIICREIGKSERQFCRKFSEIVGISPIRYIKTHYPGLCCYIF
ncbi:MAG: AraC family transcriptional regulator [Bacteroidales bacterium]|nr:AraC family transcriptional regulator [Bacteroidales bacterium]